MRGLGSVLLRQKERKGGGKGEWEGAGVGPGQCHNGRASERVKGRYATGKRATAIPAARRIVGVDTGRNAMLVADDSGERRTRVAHNADIYRANDAILENWILETYSISLYTFLNVHSRPTLPVSASSSARLSSNEFQKNEADV